MTNATIIINDKMNQIVSKIINLCNDNGISAINEMYGKISEISLKIENSNRIKEGSTVRLSFHDITTVDCLEDKLYNKMNAKQLERGVYLTAYDITPIDDIFSTVIGEIRVEDGNDSIVKYPVYNSRVPHLIINVIYHEDGSTNIAIYQYIK